VLLASLYDKTGLENLAAVEQDRAEALSSTR